jgi:hypothetical protein
LEEQLVVSVVQWGKFQVEADGGDPQDGQILRAKILPALKQIRFAVVDPKNFAKLCHRELGPVFSVGEKLAIFKAMAGNADLLPTDFCRSKRDRSPRSSGCIQLNFVDCGTEVTAHKGAEHTALLTFKINKRATLSSLCCSYVNGWSIERQYLTDEIGNVVIEHDPFYDSEFILAADKNYTQAFKFSRLQRDDDEENERSYKTFQIPANTSVTKLGFTVTAVSSTQFIGTENLLMCFATAFCYPL